MFATPAAFSSSPIFIWSWIVSRPSMRRKTSLSLRPISICFTRSSRKARRIRSLAMKTLCSGSSLNDKGTSTKSRSLEIDSARRASGSLTSTPRCSIGAVTMKMISSTSITSTSGITLISASVVETRRPRPRGAPPLGIGRTFGIPQRLLREVPFGDVQKFQGEVVQVRGVPLYLGREVVVGEHRRDRREESGSSRNQRIGDARADGRQVRRAGESDALERNQDAPDRAEQADERRGARNRREKRDALLELVHLDR